MQNVADLRLQAYIDLTLRARGGIIIYPTVWLITAFWVEMAEHTPLLFYANTILFGATALARTIHYLLFLKHPSVNSTLRYRWLIGMILFSALHWGTLSAWIIYGSPYQELHYPYMIILAAFALGGTAILSISFFTSILYPLLIFVPTVTTGKIMTTGEDNMLAVLAIFATVYVLEAARVSRKDYWNAITSHKEAKEHAIQLEKLSITDPLTGLHNRMHFNQRFIEEWARCSRLQTPLSLLMLDLDHFKSVNDNFGHISGDRCLQEVALALRNQVQRTTDTVARYGGEEFVILLPNTEKKRAAIIAQSLLQTISEITPTWGKGNSSISCSIGLSSMIPNSQKTGEILIKAADDALYQAKNQGRNRYCIANP
ncbi:MAG: GGDEF domain-containing protein [Candidatus Thiodiazotropha sp. (ex Notomyrtea botanica)]|nr:GGDEF domain-containing protein [Candidatus Thiodiazotropha sp. (ex Notomyrtea botanica)]